MTEVEFKMKGQSPRAPKGQVAMVDTLIRFNPTLLRKQLEKPDCRAYFDKKYSTIMTYYWKFLKEAGPNCNIVQAALKALWSEEMHGAPESFQKSLRTGSW